MTTPAVTAIRLAPSGSQSLEPKDALIVGPGMGTGVNSLYAGMVNKLSERFQVVGYDLPGHDQSPAHPEAIRISDIADAVAQLVHNMRTSGTIRPGAKVYFAGLSISGQVALQLALDHAEIFDGIAVLGSAAKIGEPADWDARAAMVREQGTQAMVEASASAWFAPGFAENHPQLVEPQKVVLANADNETYAQLCLALGAFDATDRLGEIAVPLVVVNGVADPMCTVADGQQIAQAAQNATFHQLADTAHLMPLEKPAELAQLLLTELK